MLIFPKSEKTVGIQRQMLIMIHVSKNVLEVSGKLRPSDSVFLLFFHFVDLEQGETEVEKKYYLVN